MSMWGRSPFNPNLSKHSQPRSTGCESVDLWVCGYLFCFSGEFFKAMLRAFGELLHIALQGHLGVKAETGLGRAREGATGEGQKRQLGRGESWKDQGLRSGSVTYRGSRNTRWAFGAKETSRSLQSGEGKIWHAW